MASKYFLDISASKCYLTEDLLKAPLANGVEHRFKVRGESRVVAIVDDIITHDTTAVESIAKYTVDNGMHSECTPLIPYESFAKTSLGVTEDEVEKKGATPAFDPEKEIYWVQVDVGYEGHALEELRQGWHDEAVVALGLVHGGKVPLVLYKSVFRKQVHLFVQMDGAALDQLNFQLPIFKALGDQIKTTTKRVTVF